MGTLFAFGMVALSVLILRRREPDAPRPFRVPFSPWLPMLSIAASGYLMWSLPLDTWTRLAVWLALGVIFYVGLGVTRKRQPS